MIRNADALLIGAGAGMGVDSGLPDFRGNEGFWRAYPPLAKLGIQFSAMANPRWFSQDPPLAWGFYGHRMHLYRDTLPHEGFALLRSWGQRLSGEVFVVTSNVDGHFQKAGFADDRVFECHGSIHHLQCSGPCSDSIWQGHDTNVKVNPETFRASDPLPTCDSCGSMARPNILMFGDWSWIADRSDQQQQLYQAFCNSNHKSLAVVECGAGLAVPTIRWHCEQEAAGDNATLIRINPRDSQGPQNTISIDMGALAALKAIDALL